MNDVLKFGKKLFTFSVVAMTLVWSLGVVALVPSVANAEGECTTLIAGDLIKVAGKATVYVVSSELKRQIIPDESVFYTWYKDFSSVKIISETCLSQFPLTSFFLTYRPGSMLVKSAEAASVYVVLPGGELAHLGNEAVAAALYGANWYKSGTLVVLPDTKLASYPDNGKQISSAVLHNGMLVKTASNSSIYYVTAGQLVMVDGALSKVTSGAVRTVSDTVFSSVEMATGSVTESTILTGTEVAPTPTVTGSLSVSLSASTPSAGNVVSNVNVEVAKFIFRASSVASVKVNSVKLGRQGLGSTGNFASVTLYDGSTKLGTTKTSWSSDNTMTYNISGGWEIPAGSIKELTVVANFGTSGKYNAVGVVDVSLASGTVSGLPVYGNQVSAVTVEDLGEATITKIDTAATKRIGSTDVKLAEFKLAVANEDGKLKKVTLRNRAATTNASDNDLANVSLYQGTTKLAGPVSMVSDKVTFVISEDAWPLIKKSQNADFKVVGDIVNGAGNHVEFVLDATTDLEVVGQTYNTNMTVTSGAFNEATEGSIITIDGSELNVAYSGTTLDTVDDKLDVSFGTLTLNAGSVDTKITQLVLTIDETNGDGNAANNLNINDFELVAADGASYIGTESGGVDGDAADVTLTFSDEIYLNAGETLTLNMRGDLPDGIGDNDSYKVVVTNMTDAITAETVSAGDAVTDFSVGSINGKLVTVKTPYLTVKPIDLNSTLKAVVNQENVVIFKGTMEAVSDSINLSRLKFEGGHTSASDVTLTVANLDNTNWASLGLYTVAADGTYTLLQNVTNSNLTEGYVDFDSFNLTIQPGSANKVTFAVKGTISATLDVTNTTVHAQLDTVTVKDSNGSTVVAKNSAGTAIVTGAELETTTKYTLGGTGTLYVAMRNADTDFNKDRVVLAGTSAWVGKLRLKAEYEAIKIKDLKLTNSASVDSSVDSVCLYKAMSVSSENLIACTDLSGSVAVFNGVNYIVNEGTQDVYVHVTTRPMSNGALGTAVSKAQIAMNIADNSALAALTAVGVDSNVDLIAGDEDGAVAASEIVFDTDLDGTFDETDENLSATTKSFYVAGSRISTVALVNSNGGETVDTTISGTGEYTLAILAITNESNSNTDVNGQALKAALDNLVLDVTKHSTTTFSGATIRRIGGTQAAGALTTTVVDGIGETSGEWTMANVTTTLGVDAQISANTVAYFVVKGTISAVDTATGVVDWVRVSLDDVTGSANDANNNIDWFDGYDTTYTTTNNFDYLFLDTSSITGTKVAEVL